MDTGFRPVAAPIGGESLFIRGDKRLPLQRDGALASLDLEERLRCLDAGQQHAIDLAQLETGAERRGGPAADEIGRAIDLVGPFEPRGEIDRLADDGGVAARGGPDAAGDAGAGGDADA